MAADLSAWISACEMPARGKRGGQTAPAPGPAKKSKGATGEKKFGGSTVMVCVGGVIENRKCRRPVPIIRI